MTDNTEKLNSALVYTGKAMYVIDAAAYITLKESTQNGDEYKSLEEIYRSLEQAKQKILELNV